MIIRGDSSKWILEDIIRGDYSRILFEEIIRGDFSKMFNMIKMKIILNVIFCNYKLNIIH